MLFAREKAQGRGDISVCGFTLAPHCLSRALQIKRFEFQDATTSSVTAADPLCPAASWWRVEQRPRVRTTTGESIYVGNSPTVSIVSSGGSETFPENFGNSRRTYVLGIHMYGKRDTCTRVQRFRRIGILRKNSLSQPSADRPDIVRRRKKEPARISF